MPTVETTVVSVVLSNYMGVWVRGGVGCILGGQMERGGETGGTWVRWGRDIDGGGSTFLIFSASLSYSSRTSCSRGVRSSF